MVKREKAVYLIQSVSHAVEVLEQLSNSSSEIGVTELSKKLNLHKNNVFRLLATLEICGLVQQNPITEDYRLGAKALKLGQAFEIQNPMKLLVDQYLTKICQATGETTNFWIPRAQQVYCYHSVESNQEVRAISSVGKSVNIWENQIGRYLLNYISEKDLAQCKKNPEFKPLSKEEQLSFNIGSYSFSQNGVKKFLCLIKSSTSIIGVVEVCAVEARANSKQILESLIDNSELLSQSFGGSLQLKLEVERLMPDFQFFQERV